MIIAVLVFLVAECVAGLSGYATDRQPQSRREVAHLKFSIDSDAAISLSPDAKAFVLIAKDRLELRRLSEPESRTILSGLKKSPHIFWSPNGDRFLTVTTEKVATVWSALSGDKLCEVEGSPKLSLLQTLKSYEWSLDGNWLAIEEPNKAIAIWNMQTGALQCRGATQYSRIDFSWSGEPNVLIVHSKKNRPFRWPKNEMQTWDVSSCRPIVTAPIGGELSADGKYILRRTEIGDELVIDPPGSPELWDADTGKLHARLNPPWCKHNNCVANYAEFSPDGKLVVVDYGGPRTDIWDVGSGTLISGVSHDDGDRSLLKGFSPDSRLLVVYREHEKSLTSFKTISSIQLYDSRTGKLMTTLSGENMMWSANQIVWSPDGSTVATAGGSHGYQGKIWDVSTGKLKATVPLIAKEGHTPFTGIYYNDLDRLSFHPTLPVLIGVSEKLVKFWDAGNGELIQTIKGSSAQWSKDRHLLITLSEDKKSSQVWELN